MTVSAEEFARWRDDRVTRWVFQALQINMEECRQAWLNASWGTGTADPALLIELRTRADAHETLIATSYQGFCETNGEEPQHDQG